jgi:cholesterol oxidase
MAIDWDIIRDEMAGRKVPAMSVGQVWYGVNSGAKQSLDQNYLRRAEATGKVKILPLHIVREIGESPEGGYKVVADVIDETGKVLERHSRTCDSLFLAAGAAGTCGLLVKAKAKGWLPRLNEHLGKNVGNVGDVFLLRHKIAEVTYPFLGIPGLMALCDYDNPYNPTVMMKVDLPRFAEIFPDSKGLGLFCFVMTPNRGEFVYDTPTESVVLEFEPNLPLAAEHLAEKLCRAADGEITSVTSQFTGHQLGGAGMGLVCDVDGRIQGYRKLYVVDGALMPGSTTCLNPAWTITAIAERCLDRILAADFTQGSADCPTVPAPSPGGTV